MEYNDERVSAVEEAVVKSEKENAYMLVYKSPNVHGEADVKDCNERLSPNKKKTRAIIRKYR